MALVYDAKHFLWTAGRMAYIVGSGPFSRKARGRLRDLSYHLGWHQHPAALTERPVDELAPPAPIDLPELARGDWNTTVTEQVVLARLARRADPKLIVELGTFDGRTSVNLLANAPAARLVTYDLPPMEGREEPGGRLRNRPDLAGRYELRRVDTRTHDFADLVGQADLIFVDAGHGYESAKPDTVNALRMRAPNGTVVWHDYATAFPGVTRAVDEARAASKDDGLAWHRVADTSLAVCVPKTLLP